MRLISFILALIVLILSCVPCADVAAATGRSATASVMASGADHHKSAHHTDCCSPFCQCSCCTGFHLPQSLLSERALVAMPSSPVYAAFLPNAPVAVSLPVWQPPQLV